LTQTYPRFDGDTAGPFIRDLARGLVSGGDEVTVLTPHAPEVRDRWVEEGVEAVSFRYAPEGSEVLGYGRSLSKDEAIRWRAGAVTPLYSLAARKALRSLVEKRDFDLVHGHWVVPNGLIVSAAALGLPTAVGLHGSDVFLAERKGVRSLVRWAMKRTRLLTGCSPELVDRICALGFPRDRSRVIPYGVDTEQFSPAPERRRIWREKLSIPSQAIVGLGVGRMVTKKGFHVLLEVLPEILERVPQAHMIFGGEGDRLEEFQKQMSPWIDRVHFPGVIYRDTLPDLYRCADFFVLPAVHDSQGNVDGLPNVILEGMASGLPIVASGISGIPLAVNHEREGLLVAEENRPKLSAALHRIYSDAQLRETLGAASRTKAISDLTWEAVAGRYREAYSEALAGAAVTV
jgi:glycosyltransferase involved in cell wall biosynthesis